MLNTRAQHGLAIKSVLSKSVLSTCFALLNTDLGLMEYSQLLRKSVYRVEHMFFVLNTDLMV